MSKFLAIDGPNAQTAQGSEPGFCRAAVYEDSRQAPSGNLSWRRGPSTPPASCRFSAASCFSPSSILSPPPHSPSQGQGSATAAKECSCVWLTRLRHRAVVPNATAVGWRATRFGPGPNDRLSVWSPQRPHHLVPFTLRASGTPHTRAHPSNERCPFGSPGGRTAALADLAWFPQHGCRPRC